MKTKLVPANLTVETFIQRVMTGESFYTEKGSRIFYKHSVHTYFSPFRYQYQDRESSFIKSWQLVPELLEKVEVTWKDEVSETNTILCWVSDDDSEKREHAALISSIDPDFNLRYKQPSGTGWHYATPVLTSECRQEEQTK